MERFRDREDAGKQLAVALAKFRADKPVVLAIPNGGIPVASPVAESLGSRLMIVPMRSLQTPWSPDVIFGYISVNGASHLNHPLIGQIRLTPQEIYQISRKRALTLQADLASWDLNVPDRLDGQTAVIVDDGMHSGWTMFSAIETVKQMGAQRVIAAVPVSHFRSFRFVSHHCDEVVSLLTSDQALYHIQDYYESFPEITNEEVTRLLRSSPPNPNQTAA